VVDFFIRPGIVEGSCLIPPSKSETQRALLFAAFSEGTSCIQNPLLSPDTKRLLSTFTQMGVGIHFDNAFLTIKGVGRKPSSMPNEIDCGNSGILLRFLSAIAASFSNQVMFTGDLSLQQLRSCKPLLNALRQLGVKVTYLGKEGFAPFTIQGPLQTGEITLDGSDSQPVSALLLASAISGVPLTVHVVNPGEKPWVEMTLSWLQFLGVDFDREGHNYFSVRPKRPLASFSYAVPEDLSTAAFPAAAAIVSGGSVFLEKVNFSCRQGDKLLFSFFQEMGAEVRPTSKGVLVKASSFLRGIDVDANDCIDAVAVLSAVAVAATTPTTIRNVAKARSKECDRLSAIVKEWKKLGITVKETEDSLTIFPKKPSGGVVSSHQDHRIAMSLAVLGLFAKNEVRVQNISCIEKTFSGFTQVLARLGANCAVC